MSPSKANRVVVLPLVGVQSGRNHRNPSLRQAHLLQPGLMAAVLDHDEQGRLLRKAGVMGLVLIGGEVRPGDAIRVELPPKPHRRREPV